MMSDQSNRPDEYYYRSSAPAHTHDYLSTPIKEVVVAEAERRSVSRIFELGCGSGSFAHLLYASGFDVTAVDVSESGITHARNHYTGPRFGVGSAYDDLAATYGEFDLVISLEVVEHLYSPRKWAENIRRLLVPGGLAVISTPFHGYWKNLAIALKGQFDQHMDPLWDHGHIKMWSVRTLSALLSEVGLRVERVHLVGRIPPFAKSMVVLARKSPS